VWRRWTTEWTLEVQAQALSLACPKAGSQVRAQVHHDDLPAARAMALKQALADLRGQHPDLLGVKRVRVQFDDQWATWLSLQGEFWRLKATQRDALVRSHLARQLAMDADQWRVCTQVQVKGDGLLACAIAQQRWLDLNEALGAAGLQPVSVRPHWAVRLAQMALPASQGVVARIEGNLLSVAVLEQGEWIRVASLLVDREDAWAPRAKGWLQTAGLAFLPEALWFDGPVSSCPAGWTALEPA